MNLPETFLARRSDRIVRRAVLLRQAWESLDPRQAERASFLRLRLFVMPAAHAVKVSDATISRVCRAAKGA